MIFIRHRLGEVGAMDMTSGRIADKCEVMMMLGVRCELGGYISKCCAHSSENLSLIREKRTSFRGVEY